MPPRIDFTPTFPCALGCSALHDVFGPPGGRPTTQSAHATPFTGADPEALERLRRVRERLSRFYDGSPSRSSATHVSAADVDPAADAAERATSTRSASAGERCCGGRDECCGGAGRDACDATNGDAGTARVMSDASCAPGIPAHDGSPDSTAVAHAARELRELLPRFGLATVDIAMS